MGTHQLPVKTPTTSPTKRVMGHIVRLTIVAQHPHASKASAAVQNSTVT